MATYFFYIRLFLIQGLVVCSLKSMAQASLAVVFVTENGAGAKNGIGWANAFDKTQFQVAINSASAYAQANPTVTVQMWVASGTYKPTTGQGRNVVFAMANKVAIYGGFLGTENRLVDRPNLTNNPSTSILSGDIGVVGNLSDNSYHVLVNQNLNATAVLDGFVITGGNADVQASSFSGGGMVNQGGTPVVRNCVFDNNRAMLAGGALFNLENGNPTLQNCTFSHNSVAGNGSDGRGGAICNITGSSPSLTDCVFQENTALFGGAMASSADCSPTLENCSFSNNTAVTGAGALFNDSSSPTLRSCTFSGNMAPVGGAVENKENSSPSLTDCTFKQNKASNLGGAIYNLSGSSPSLTNCVLESNTALAGGGQYNSLGCNPTFINCLLLANRATGIGGAVFHLGNGTVSLLNCTLSQNTAANETGGVLAGQGAAGLITNSILWGNTPTQVEAVGGTFTVRNTLIDQDGFAGQNGNIRANPLFQTISLAGSLPLQPCSPAINKGDNAAYTAANGPINDLDGFSRFFNNGIIDLGASEYQALPPQPISLLTQPAALSIVCPGATVTVSVSTTGVVSSYQWYRSGVALTGVASATTATLTLVGVTPASTGSYSVVITGSCNSVTSTAFSLSINQLTTAYVTQNGAGNQTGSSWLNAFPGTSLQNVLVSACPSTTVLVASGLYKPTTGTDRTISFAMRNGVQIYGGFQGIETGLANRMLTYPSSTTLSGDIGTAGNNADNSYHVFNNAGGLNASALLDGVVITGGKASDAVFPHSSGGGMLNNGRGTFCSPTLRNCLFVNNGASGGGAVFNDGQSSGNSSPLFINCAFLNNMADQIGGAMINFGLRGTSSPQLVNCSFTGNQSGNNVGGAIYSEGNQGSSNPQLINCIVFGNEGVSALATANGTLTASYCLFETSMTGYTGSTNLTTTTTPFVSTTTGNLRLPAGSVAINAGNSALYTSANGTPYDLGGNTRIQGTAIDIGALELEPDLVPILYAQPSTLYNTSPITLVVDVVELNGVSTSGPVTVKINKDRIVSLNLPSGATTLGGHSVQNSAWSLTELANEDYYVLTTSQSIAASNKLSFGLSGVLSPGATKGSLSLSATVVGGSGGDQKIINNSDADKIEYFHK